MIYARPRKSLGQHYLTDTEIANRIVNSLTLSGYDQILEIGPGRGVLTESLLSLPARKMIFVEIDNLSVEVLKNKLPGIRDKILTADILKINMADLFEGPFAVIGNFPYNISSQLFFRILETKHQVIEVVCMLQKEVAIRIASPPGSRDYGILSVFLQAYYQIELLFTVPPEVFYPQPKVQSAVIRLKRNDRRALPCDEKLFTRIVKTAFNQRRKVMQNSLKNFFNASELQETIFRKRPEQLGVEDFIHLTLLAGEKPTNNLVDDLSS